MIKISDNAVIAGIVVFVSPFILFGVMGIQFPAHFPKKSQTQAMLQAQAISGALEQYASNHNGRYPEGKTSTEAFQKLLDDRYVTDPGIFFYPLSGKTRPINIVLKPENVGWDMTCCVDENSPVDLPIVFISGNKISYQAGASAVPLKLPTISAPLEWNNWWKPVRIDNSFIAVSYKQSARVIYLTGPDYAFHDFISNNFDPKGKVYRQLTPNGVVK